MNNIEHLFKRIKKYSDRYQFTFQFWGEGNNNVFIDKDDVDIYNTGGYDTPEEVMEAAIEFLDKINRYQPLPPIEPPQTKEG
jgi:hypothetical protein